MDRYYDGTKLLSLKDIDGNTPEIYMVTTNRTGGKTTYFGRLMINRFLKRKEKFALLYRYAYEVDDCADKFFKDIGGLFFPDSTMTSKIIGNGFARHLLLDGEPCGYAFALNSADQIKKHSHLFSDVSAILFDEFQSENGDYCPKEISKFQSVHMSIARGQHKQVRYVPVYMLSNAVSLLNPYYIEFDIASRIQKDTKFMRGHGWVLEQGYVDSAARAQMQSGFVKAFSNTQYTNSMSGQAVYLNDNYTFIERPTGRFTYLATINYENKNFSIKEYPDSGIVYIDTSVDMQYPVKISATTADHKINQVIMRTNTPLIIRLKYYFDMGCIRFRNLECKKCLFALVSSM